MRSPQNTLLIRADASAEIGAGHVMRCLALGQAWRDRGGRVCFACSSLPETFAERLKQEKMDLLRLPVAASSSEDSAATRQAAAAQNAGALVLDLYGVPSAFANSLADKRWKLLCLDDNAERDSYSADFILNQNAHATRGLYSAKCGPSSLLLGPSYALLRSEFSPYQNWLRDVSAEPAKILLSLGGGNQVRALMHLLDRLAPILQDLELSLVLARSYENIPALEKRLRELDLRCRLMISPENMAQELARHDFLISSGGATVWEALYMQIPACFVVIAPNQAASCRHLRTLLDHPVAESIESLDPEAIAACLRLPARRETMARQGRQIVDGKGTERIIERLLA